jgi:hypothetical protein
MWFSSTGDLYVGGFVSVVFNVGAGTLAAFCLVKLTCQFGGIIVTFVEHLFR